VSYLNSSGSGKQCEPLKINVPEPVQVIHPSCSIELTESRNSLGELSKIYRSSPVDSPQLVHVLMSSIQVLYGVALASSLSRHEGTVPRGRPVDADRACKPTFDTMA